MTEIPQDAHVVKRQLTIMTMRAAQNAIQAAVRILVTEGRMGEGAAATFMRNAARQCDAAAVLLSSRAEAGKVTL